MNSTYRYFLITIICIGNKSFAQIGSHKAYFDSIEQIQLKMERLQRFFLDKEDSLTINHIHQQVTNLLINQNNLIDSLMIVVRNNETPMVLAEKITDEILRIDSHYSIEALLKNFDIVKFDDRHPAGWDKEQYPCFNTLHYSNRLLEIYDFILNTDYLENYNIFDLNYGQSIYFQSSTEFLTQLFQRYSASRELIRDALRHNHSEKYKQILNTVLDELK